MDRQRSVALIIYRSSDYDRVLMRGMVACARHHGPWVFYLSGASPGLPFPQVEAVSISGTEFRKRGAGGPPDPSPRWRNGASTAGFNSLSYLERVFRRATGMSLAKYGRRHRQASTNE